MTPEQLQKIRSNNSQRRESLLKEAAGHGAEADRYHLDLFDEIDSLLDHIATAPPERTQKVPGKAGINPVTIRTPGQPHVTVARLHVGDGKTIVKNLTIALFPADGTPQPIGIAVLDEVKFITAMQHLFPNGELSRARE